MNDIHTHLHFSDYDADREMVIARACAAGVEKMILIGTDLESSQRAVKLAEQYEFLYVSIGIHPHTFNEIEKELQNADCRMQIEELRKLVRQSGKIVAIGECGLDYFVRGEETPIGEDTKNIQRRGFLAQIEVAREFKLPVIIHTRPSAETMDAYEDMYLILQSEIFSLKSAIFHCYQGNAEVTKKFLGLPNVYFSFAGSITYPVKKTIEGTKNDPREVVKMIPLDQLFVETDCPYLAPQPVRGTRNEPVYVRMTAETVAGIRGIDTDELESVLDKTFSRVFQESKMGM